MNVEACKNLSLEELKYIVNQFTLIQNISSKGFKHSYYHHYLQKEKFEDSYRKIEEQGGFGL